MKTEGCGEKGGKGKEVTEINCELRIHFTVRLIQRMEPSPIRPTRTVRLLQKFRNTWPLASFEPISEGNGEWVWKGYSNKSLKEDAVDSIELNYWELWKKEVTKWSEKQGSGQDEDVEFWKRVCDGLNYSLSLPPNAQAGKQALVSKIFQFDSKDIPFLKSSNQGSSQTNSE